MLATPLPFRDPRKPILRIVDQYIQITTSKVVNIFFALLYTFLFGHVHVTNVHPRLIEVIAGFKWEQRRNYGVI